MTHERAGAIGHTEAGRAPRRPGAVGSAVRGDHHLRRRSAGEVAEPAFSHAAFGQPIADDGIVDEFTEDGERSLLGEAFRLGDGVADAKTKAVVFCELDFHSWIVSYFVMQSFRAK